MLFSVPSTMAINTSIPNNHFLDFDPLVDVTVTVEIIKIRSLEKEDIQLFFEEVIDENSDPDFYVKVFINNQEFVSEVWSNTRYIYDPQWSATLNVADDEEFVDIKIQLWDCKDENVNEDRLCDISGDYNNSNDSYDIELTYSIKTGRWTGDDSLNADPSGYGRLNGCDDGTIYEKDRDCELWFNIYQNDYDGDMIPYWAEENIYGTDPEVEDSGDPDGDNIPTSWEWKWGYNPLVWEDHVNTDPDEDSINNYEEYLTSEWFSDPFRKDIFVEMDKMEDGPNGEITYFPEGSKEIIQTAFNRRNMVFHLDDGCMGGSEAVPFDEKADYREIINFYKDYFLHGSSNNWRRGVFHYGIVTYSVQGPAGFMFRPNAFQITSKGHEKISNEWWSERDVVYASAYMHELGHTFNFNPIPGHNKASFYPWQIGWWINRPYKSCMNYGYMYYTVDYSDGTRSYPDLNDWERMDFSYFERSWL